MRVEDGVVQCGFVGSEMQRHETWQSVTEYSITVENETICICLQWFEFEHISPNSQWFLWLIDWLIDLTLIAKGLCGAKTLLLYGDLIFGFFFTNKIQ